MTSSRNWSSLTKADLKRETREFAAAQDPDVARASMTATLELNAAELESLAARLGSAQDYMVPLSYAEQVRARVGLATPVSTSVETQDREPAVLADCA